MHIISVGQQGALLLTKSVKISKKDTHTTLLDSEEDCRTLSEGTVLTRWYIEF